MNTDDIINTFKDTLGQQPSLESVEGERESTLKKVFTSKALANLKDRIVCASENIGYDLEEMLKLQGLTNNMHPYLESHVRRVLGNTDQ